MMRSLRKYSLLVSVSLVFLLPAWVAHTQATSTADQPSEGRSTAFEAVTGNQGESVDGARLLIAAYSFLGLALSWYVFFILRRQIAIAKDIESLEEQLGSLANRDKTNSDKTDPQSSLQEMAKGN